VQNSGLTDAPPLQNLNCIEITMEENKVRMEKSGQHSLKTKGKQYGISTASLQLLV